MEPQGPPLWRGVAVGWWKEEEGCDVQKSSGSTSINLVEGRTGTTRLDFDPFHGFKGPARFTFLDLKPSTSTGFKEGRANGNHEV